MEYKLTAPLSKADAAKLPFLDDTFDAAVSNFVFHEVRSQRDKQALIREALRVVKPGGAFAFRRFNPAFRCFDPAFRRFNPANPAQKAPT